MEKPSEVLINALLVKRSEPNFYKFCFECLKNPTCYVLVLTKEVPSLVELAKNVPKHDLRRLVVMQFDKIESVGRRLLILHEWEIVPSLVVLDLWSFLRALNTRSFAQINQSVCFTIASLVNYMQKLKLESTLSRIPTSITLLPRDACGITSTEIKLLRNLYFYKNSIFRNTEDVFQIALHRINPDRVAKSQDIA